WTKDWDAMATKTVIRNMLSKWGILSIEMRDAYTADIDTKLEYGDDLGTNSAIDLDFTEVEEVTETKVDTEQKSELEELEKGFVE
ncbi:MAG: phiCTC2B 12, partial [Bacilli bacterium]|nr:phiCTC2B 12 [Bacilli bacterium]